MFCLGRQVDPNYSSCIPGNVAHPHDCDAIRRFEHDIHAECDNSGLISLLLPDLKVPRDESSIAKLSV